MLKSKREARHKSIRRKVSGTPEKPRVAVYRSTQHIYAQIINDVEGKTLAASSDVKIEKGTKIEKAKQVGLSLAQQAVKNKINQVVFDRGGIKYHGRVAALAEGLRKGGLKF